ncbi:WG repeat-containing protein [Hymenobacter yonginensis]|uniref:WG repeat-containing protein n=1 Tax=Hymenobacter yonginensis TaxID=748197 RepID=A0ABY7PU51_9BACT|nr:WG repeat-containing protein [Hymenobacter yonginensis]WBO86089.1 WG repeat-containing protein [Hymenobacter yonginensis]
MNADGAWAVLDARGRVVIPYAQRPVRVLTSSLVKVGHNSGPARWAVLNLQGRQLLPQEYEEVESAGCDHIQLQQGNETLLLDARGQVVYREPGTHHFTALPRFNRLLVAEVGRNQVTGPVRMLELTSKREVYTHRPAAEAAPLYLDLTPARGAQRIRLLPFLKITTIIPGKNQVQRIERIVNLQGQVLFDSLDAGVETGPQQLVYLRRRGHPVIVTDTLLRPLPALSGYASIVPTGPARRWFAVARDGKSGLLDASGRPVVPTQQTGQFFYVGNRQFLLRDVRNRRTHLALFSPERGLVDVGEYTTGQPLDSTLAQPPLVLQDERTHKSGLYDLQRGFLIPPRYDVLQQTPLGFIFFQQDSVGYLSHSGQLRLLTPDCQLLSEFTEGYAVCGKLVPNASRDQYPGAQLIHSAQGSTAVQYTYQDAAGKQISADYFDWVGPFHGGYALVRKHNESYGIDTKGQKVTYSGGLVLASYFHQGVALVRQGKLFGLIDQRGRLVLPARFTSIETEPQYAGSSNLVGQHRTTNTLEPVTVPRLQQGRVRVVDTAGQSQLLEIVSGK